MFEHHHEKLLPRNLFLKRLAKYAIDISEFCAYLFGNWHGWLLSF